MQLTLNKTDSPNSSVTLIAGTKAGQGAVLSRGDIDAGDSGIIGNSVKLEATGSIRGLVVAKNSIDLNAQQNVNVTALASGGVKVNAGGSVSGTIVGLAGISATGGSIDAALLSQNVSASGNVTSAQVGFSSANASTSSSQNVGPKESEPGQAKPSLDTDDSKKRATAKPQLARTTGRVTVILPNEAKSN